MIKNRKEEFIKFIEKTIENGDVSYIEAIVYYCQQKNVEMESVIPLIPKTIKERLEGEAIDLNFLKSNTHKLPIDD